MPYCTNCGAQYDDGAKFCPTCGATTGEAAQSNAQQNADYTNPTQPAQQPVQTDNSKTMAILAVVFPILFFLPIVTNPRPSSAPSGPIRRCFCCFLAWLPASPRA